MSKDYKDHKIIIDCSKEKVDPFTIYEDSEGVWWLHVNKDSHKK